MRVELKNNEKRQIGGTQMGRKFLFLKESRRGLDYLKGKKKFISRTLKKSVVSSYLSRKKKKWGQKSQEAQGGGHVGIPDR